MPGPQSTTFFVLLMVVFGGLITWLVVAKHVVFRVLAACLAFVPAVMFGVAAVNKYYDYYQSWNSAISDFTGSGLPATAVVSGKNANSALGISTVLNNDIYTQLAAQQGYTLQIQVHGKLSGITRTVLVFLPPQYFQPAYKGYRFPAIELIHGFPGGPNDWLTAMGVTQIYNQLLSTRQAKPAVLVIPDANGARGVSLQCLNQVGGPQDATYLAKDVPAYLNKVLRIWGGRTWGIAGYSEGGYCAANLGVQYGSTFDAAGVMSGYFAPFKNQFPSGFVNPFGKSKALATLNDPMKELLNLPPGVQVAQFWLGAGNKSIGDVHAAELFRQLASFRQPGAPLLVVPGGHTMYTWRQLAAPMLTWMTTQLTNQLQAAQARAQKAAAQHPTASPTPGKSGSLPAPGASPFPTKSSKPGKSPTPKPSSR